MLRHYLVIFIQGSSSLGNTFCKYHHLISDQKYSRYMVATRNLKAGDIILREKAAVVGPSLEQSKAGG